MSTYLNAAVVKHGQTQKLRCDVDELCVSHILWVFVEWNALGHLHGAEHNSHVCHRGVHDATTLRFRMKEKERPRAWTLAKTRGTAAAL